MRACRFHAFPYPHVGVPGCDGQDITPARRQGGGAPLLLPAIVGEEPFLLDAKCRGRLLVHALGSSSSLPRPRSPLCCTIHELLRPAAQTPSGGCNCVRASTPFRSGVAPDRQRRRPVSTVALAQPSVTRSAGLCLLCCRACAHTSCAVHQPARPKTPLTLPPLCPCCTAERVLQVALSRNAPLGFPVPSALADDMARAAKQAARVEAERMNKIGRRQVLRLLQVSLRLHANEGLVSSQVGAIGSCARLCASPLWRS